MNGVARAFIATFFGWLRNLFNGVWSFFQDTSGGGFVDFLLRHWKAAALALIALGVLIDLLFYFLGRRNKG